MLVLKIFVRVQTFRRRPFVPSHNFYHPALNIDFISFKRQEFILCPYISKGLFENVDSSLLQVTFLKPSWSSLTVSKQLLVAAVFACPVVATSVLRALLRSPAIGYHHQHHHHNHGHHHHCRHHHGHRQFWYTFYFEHVNHSESSFSSPFYCFRFFKLNAKLPKFKTIIIINPIFKNLTSSLRREMAPHAYVSTYQGDFGGRWTEMRAVVKE